MPKRPLSPSSRDALDAAARLGRLLTDAGRTDNIPLPQPGKPIEVPRDRKPVEVPRGDRNTLVDALGRLGGPRGRKGR